MAWGFGGKVTPGQFAPVSVLVDNPASDAFDGTLTLYRANFVGERRGAELVEPVFLSPTQRRWVTFYVLPLESSETWVLRAADPAGTEFPKFTLPKPGHAAPQVALLTAPDDVTARVPKVPRMQEDLFPPRPEATGGLRGAVLDHAPEWGQVRAASFRTWLEGGGTLHLLTGPDDVPPRFSGELADLNDPRDRFAVGRGRVLRHSRRLDQYTGPLAERELLPDAGFVPPTVEDLAFKTKREQQAGGFAMSYDPTRIEEEILPTLRRMVRPDHSWGTIHVLCLGFVAALFPGVFLVGRERRGYPATLGLLVLVTVCFGVALRTVGRRGYGESESVRTTALARALPDGRTDVSQWADAFVTAGGDYSFSAAAPAGLYSCGEDTEPVKGTLLCGTGGKVTADVPPFSSRAFVSRTLRDDLAPQVTVKQARVGRTADGTGTRLSAFSLQLPPDLKTFQILAVHGRRVYQLRRGADGAASVSGTNFPLPNLLTGYGVPLISGVSVRADPYEGGYYDPYENGYDPYGYQVDDAELIDRGLDSSARQVIGRDLGLVSAKGVYDLAAPAGTVRVYLTGPLRDEHRVLGAPGDGAPAEPFANQNGVSIFAYGFPL